MTATQPFILATSRGVITGANLTTAATGTDALTYTSASFTPTSKALILVCCGATHAGSVDPSLPTVTDSGGLTWTTVLDFKWMDTGVQRARMQIFAAQAELAPGSRTVLIDYGVVTSTSNQMSIVEFYQTAVNSGVAQCFVQSPTTTANASGTGGSITLAAVAQPANRPFSFWLHGVNEVTAPRANWTELGDASAAGPGVGIETQYRSDVFETTATATWATSAGFGGIALEIKAS